MTWHRIGADGGHCTEPAEIPAHAYARGHADGRADEAAEQGRALADLERVIVALEAALAADIPSLEPLIRAAVRQLVVDVVEDQCRIDGAGIAARVAAACGRLSDAVALTLVLNPDDEALVGDRAGKLSVSKDDQLPRGAFRLDGGDATITDSLGARIDRLMGTTP